MEIFSKAGAAIDDDENWVRQKACSPWNSSTYRGTSLIRNTPLLGRLHGILLDGALLKAPVAAREGGFFIDSLLVRIHFIIVMIRWTGLAPREFEFPFPGSLTSPFLITDGDRRVRW